MVGRASASGPICSSIAVVTASFVAIASVAPRAGAATPPRGEALLSVATDPAGAVVYVDGLARGTTPVEMSVTPGEHRVRLEKHGYLENSRIVSVAAGRARPVRVNLTRHAQVEARPRPQPTPAPLDEGGGGGKKWLFLSLGAAAVVGTAVYLATRNDPPTPGTISVTPTGTGMAGITAFSFSSSASDPDGDALTFNWDFGDGSTGSGQQTTKVFNSVGSFSVQLSISDGSHTVNALPLSVTVARSMAGVWSGATEPGFLAGVSLNLTQNGTNLGGTLTFSGFFIGTLAGLTGTVSGTTYPTNVSFQSPNFRAEGLPGTFQERFSGTVDASGNTMSGTCTATATSPDFDPPTISAPCTFRR